MNIEKLIAEHDGPLPELSADERKNALLKLRLVKAGVLKRMTAEKQHRGEALHLTAEFPHIKMNC